MCCFFVVATNADVNTSVSENTLRVRLNIIPLQKTTFFEQLCHHFLYYSLTHFCLWKHSRSRLNYIFLKKTNSSTDDVIVSLWHINKAKYQQMYYSSTTLLSLKHSRIGLNYILLQKNKILQPNIKTPRGCSENNIPSQQSNNNNIRRQSTQGF